MDASKRREFEERLNFLTAQYRHYEDLWKTNGVLSASSHQALHDYAQRTEYFWSVPELLSQFKDRITAMEVTLRLMEK